MRFLSLKYLPPICLLALASCRSDIQLLLPEQESAGTVQSVDSISGFYLLNEGNMGANKATLDWYDYATATYTRNIYVEANPTTVKDLGDVGNDLAIYGSRLWAVINCSNKVEVMDARSAQRLGQVDIPNCRYMAFCDGYAYVTSYAGPVQTGADHAQLGYVAKIDTATLQIVDTCLVGYQPDGLAVQDGLLYVANSGGYMEPNYENHLSVIDLSTFQEIRRIPVAINLQHVVADNRHQLWVSNRGDYYDVAAKLYCVDTQRQLCVDSLDIAVGSMTLVGDSLYIVGSQWSYLTMENETSYAIVDVALHQQVSDNFITDATETSIATPYAVAVDPLSHLVYLTDARDYVSPGRLHCYNPQGELQWSVRTGDIPAHIAFLSASVSPSSQVTTPADSTAQGSSPYVERVWQYCPAPGQFVNLLPEYESGDTYDDMLEKATLALADNAQGTISLGGFGGYVVVGFDHMVENRAGEMDLRILGNAFYSSASDTLTGSSEPGSIWVSYDANANGQPDDLWYELAGSEHNSAATIHDYSVTYRQPSDSLAAIPWTDNQGNQGELLRVSYHTQPYFPQWISDEELTFSGTRLADNATLMGSSYQFSNYPWGYADNHPNTSWRSCVNIEWAVDQDGQSVSLPGIHFLKIVCAMNQQCGPLGETSTEVMGVTDLHLE